MQPEKLNKRFLIARKKNYIAIKQDLDHRITIDIKGFKFKKRISSLMQQETCKMVVQLGFLEVNYKAAIAYVQERLISIHRRVASVHDLSCSGSFKKSFQDVPPKKHNASMAAAYKEFLRGGSYTKPLRG